MLTIKGKVNYGKERTWWIEKKKRKTDPKTAHRIRQLTRRECIEASLLEIQNERATIQEELDELEWF